MCVIIHLPPGKEIETQKLWNAACNNWHGWGLGIQKPGKIEIVRSMPENCHLDDKDPNCGGNFNEIGDITTALEQNIDFDRYLHLRHATRGNIDMDNCHPIPVYHDDNRDVFFMHNGQFGGGLGDPGPSSIIGVGRNYGQNLAQGTGMSDTVDFVRNHLAPPLKRFVQGDYNDPMFLSYIWSKLWKEFGTSSRGLLFGTDMTPLKAGFWHNYKKSNSDEVEFYASNDTYFDRVQRGPIFQESERQRRVKEQEEREKRAAETKTGSETTGTSKTKEVGEGKIQITQYSPTMFQPDKDALQGLFNLVNMFGAGVDGSTIAALRLCSIPEFEVMIETAIKENNVKALAYLIDRIVGEFGEVYDDQNRIREKQRKAEAQVVKLKEQLEAKNVKPESSAAA